ncbi:hypothetical protein JTB14_023697 [Gonioctena quinquepunctata]|nr:hypothetical protein JTB14_023697 [Gonioctena quinquepunctata]
MSSRGYNLRQPGARTNHQLDRDFVWPHHFGVDNTPNDRSNQITCVSEPCIQTSENIPSQGQIVPNEVHNPENLHGIETISQKSRHSRHSMTSSIRSRRRELALNMEEAKQEIEKKKLELDNKLKLLQIEHEFHEQEINETRECESIKSTRSLYPTVRVLTPISQPPSSPKTTEIQNWTITRGDWMKYDYLQGLPFQNITSRPMILLGQDNINLTGAREVCQGPENTPIATKTHLG